MTTTKDNFHALSRAIGPAFNRAAPEAIRWATEAAFFERAIRECKAKMPDGSYRNVLAEGVVNGHEATIESCRAAARQIAAMGITCNPVAKLVYFIPRRARERADGETASAYASVPWVVDATPSYMGMCYIGTHYAGARVFGASEVYKADVFEPHGPFRLPTHRPTTDVTLRDEKQCIGFYAGVRLGDGDERSEYIDYPTEQRIRGLSKVPNSLMYVQLWTEGGKKIALRRLCKLVLVGNERMLAAETAMTRSEGFTFDEHGDVVDEGVPRGTPAPNGSKPERGMSGLRGKLDTATERATEGATAGEGKPPPAAKEPSGDGQMTPKASLLALPAPSKHPEGSIEWFLDQLNASQTLDRLDEIKVAALQARVDQGDDADTFRGKFADRRRALRGITATRATGEFDDHA